MKFIIQLTSSVLLIFAFSVHAKSAEKCEFSSHAYQALDATDRANPNLCSDAAIDATLPSCPGYNAKTAAKKKSRASKAHR